MSITPSWKQPDKYFQCRYARLLSSFCPRKQHGWDKELHCCRPKNGRRVSWRAHIEIHHVSSCFRREIHWFSFTSSHCSTCWSSKKTSPSYFPHQKKTPLDEPSLAPSLTLGLPGPIFRMPRLCDLPLLGRGNFQSWSSFRWDFFSKNLERK